MPTQKEIEAEGEIEANLKIAKLAGLEGLAAAYRAEKARAELADRQYAELSQCPNAWDSDAWNTMLARHEAERKAAGI